MRKRKKKKEKRKVLLSWCGETKRFSFCLASWGGGICSLSRGRSNGRFVIFCCRGKRVRSGHSDRIRHRGADGSRKPDTRRGSSSCLPRQPPTLPPRAGLPHTFPFTRLSPDTERDTTVGELACRQKEAQSNQTALFKYNPQS